MSHVIVLAGGSSDERAVSLRSGAAVTAALGQAGHQVTQLDPADGLEQLLPRLQQGEVVFPALHGLGGEDGSLQEFLETHDITYVGSDSQSSKLCFYKDLSYERMTQSAIKTPVTELVSLDQFNASPLRARPFVLKPNDGGSSIDTFIVRDLSALDQSAVEAAFGRHDQLILQELIKGDEVTVAIVGDQPLPVIEIIPPSDQEFDYENKYNGATQELCPPLHISDEHQVAAQTIASSMHQAFGCRDMSRTDIMIDSSGTLWTLEINTIPGLTDQSLLPKAAAAAGLAMPRLCDELVKAALARG
jgi:D-alanine-D-alanine ligase